jgi:hypothetical protein
MAKERLDTGKVLSGSKTRCDLARPLEKHIRQTLFSKKERHQTKDVFSAPERGPAVVYCSTNQGKLVLLATSFKFSLVM